MEERGYDCKIEKDNRNLLCEQWGKANPPYISGKFQMAD